jgi:GH25 family lysozyme M1 (1,4-beta-N-acetylmuramidase)
MKRTLGRKSNQLSSTSHLIAATFIGLALVLTFNPGRASAQRAMGIDVYSGHGTITWSSVRGADYTWAWAKATEGVGFTDSQFVNNINNARAAGVLIGPYHYARYDLGNSGAAEANWFWSVVSPYLRADGGNIMPMLDVEQNTSLSQAQVSAWVVDFCQTFIAKAATAGLTVKMIIYTYPSYADTYINTSVSHTYLLDMANLNGQDPQTGSPYLSTWPTWTSWQWSWTVRVPGVPGDANGFCLMDVFNGSLTQMKSAFVIGGHYPTDGYSGNDANGNMQIFLPDAANILESDWQSCANCSWVGWSSFGGPLSSGAPAMVGYNSDQRMQVFMRAADNTLWSAWKTALNGGWSSGANFGGNIAGNVSVGYLPDGSMQLFARGPANTVQTMWQTSPNSGWTTWSDMGGSAFGDPTCGANADGRMQLFVRSSGNTLQSNFKTGSGAWFGWADYGGSIVGKPAAANLPDGSMQVFVRSSANTVKTISQTAPNGTWGSWSDLGGDCQGDPDVGYNADGRLQLFIPTSSGAISTTYKTTTAPNAPWSAWAALGGNYHGQLAVGYNQDGRMQLFLRDPSYNLQSTWQTAVSASASWSGWLNMGGNTPAVTITTQPASQTINRGSSATFNVAASGALTYQWRFNGANISGATGSSYTVSNVQLANAGVYSVVVGNNGGSITSSDATLMVTVFSDNFDSGNLNNWTATASPATALTVSTAQHHSGSYSAQVSSSLNRMYHNLGVSVASHAIATFWIYDNGGTQIPIVDVRGYNGAGYSPSGTVQQVLGVGKYNTVTMTGETYDSTKYQGRVYAGSSTGWFNLNGPGAPSRSVGWHRFTIERLNDGTTVKYSVDGIVCRTITGAANTVLDSVVIGSTGSGAMAGNAWEDDISVTH